MHDAVWEPAPPPAPSHLYRALPRWQKLVVHLAAQRLRTAGEAAAGESPWPTPDEISALLGLTAEAPLPACTVARLGDAAQRLARAVERGERVGIHGDYDVDGVTATALLAEWLTALGAPVEVFLPHRERDGYGLGAAALTALAARGCRVVVAVDCGVTALAEARLAAELGLELIIVDHHEPAAALPEPALMVDPKLDGDSPDACLAAVGLSYRLCEAMVGAGAGSAALLASLHDLVALGTIADVCPLTGPNRQLVLRGLAALRATERPGLPALARLAGVDLARASADDVAYRLAPRLNAAGRLGDAVLAYELLTTRDPALAEQWAQELHALNSRRQALTDRAVAEAVAQLGMVNGEPRLLFARHDNWPIGVIGLVAGRIAERYHRPALALAPNGAQYIGSARSIDGFDIAAALQSCGDLLVRCGGHARAAGLTVEAANLEPLRQRLAALAASGLADDRLRRRYRPEASVQLTSLTTATVRQMERLGPFGEGNRPPLLLVERAQLAGLKGVGTGSAHARITLAQGPARQAGILFRADLEALPPVGSSVDALFTPKLDVYRGVERVDLQFVALRPAAD